MKLSSSCDLYFYTRLLVEADKEQERSKYDQMITEQNIL